jgi:hypothetical protein
MVFLLFLDVGGQSFPLNRRVRKLGSTTAEGLGGGIARVRLEAGAGTGHEPPKGGGQHHGGHPGVFVPKVSTDEWEPDPDVPGSEMHELVHAGAAWAGLTRFTSVDVENTWHITTAFKEMWVLAFE